MTHPNYFQLNGLQYIPNFISPQEQDTLLQQIDTQPWTGDLKRRVQHYGYRYNYKSRAIALSMYLGELPDWAAKIAARIYQENYINDIPDQVIVNEYQPGQGISQHVDCRSCFTDTIISLSLGSSCMMDFRCVASTEKKSLFLEPGSLLVLKDEARYQWMHAIPPRKIDKLETKKIPRNRRVSLTFRKVIIDS